MQIHRSAKSSPISRNRFSVNYSVYRLLLPVLVLQAVTTAIKRLHPHITSPFFLLLQHRPAVYFLLQLPVRLSLFLLPQLPAHLSLIILLHRHLYSLLLTAAASWLIVQINSLKWQIEDLHSAMAVLLATAPHHNSSRLPFQCVKNIIFMSENEYEYIRVDFLLQIRIQIY